MQRDFHINPILINHQSQPGKHSWVKIFIYEPADLETLQSRGTMYAVLSLSAKTDLDYVAVMQTILELLQTQYFQQQSGGILQTLEATLDEIHKKLILMGQKDKKLAESFKFNLLTAVSWGTVLYFGQLGTSRAALYREGKLFDIDEGEQKTTNLYLSSGVLKTGDKIILGTSQLFKLFNKTQLKQILAKPDDQVASALEVHLTEGPSRSEQSGIVLSVDIKQVPSVKDESIAILDPASLPDSSSTSSMFAWLRYLNPINAFIFIATILRYKLFGRIPLLPILIAAIALLVLGYSLIFSNLLPAPAPDLNQEIITSATENLDQAEEVIDINPDRAHDLLTQAQSTIDQGLQTHPDHQQLAELQARHQQLLQQILITTELDATTIAQLDILPTQPSLVVSDQQIYVIDGQNQSLIAISPTGNVQTFAQSNQITPQAQLTFTEGGLMLVNQSGAMPISSTGQLGQVVALPHSSPVISTTHFDVNGYALAQNGQIYRIPRNANGIGQISTYFNQPISSEGLIDIAVDGYVYVLRQEGSVEQYLNGSPQTFLLERSSLTNGGRAIFANVGSQRIYILKSDALAAWTKDGQYVGQYTLPNTSEWQMATIDEASKALYVLANKQLFKATLP